MKYTNIDRIRNLTNEARLNKVRIPDVVHGIGRIIQAEAKKGQDSIVIDPNYDSELGRMLLKHDHESLDQVIAQLKGYGYDAKIIHFIAHTPSLAIHPAIKLSVSWAETAEQ